MPVTSFLSSIADKVTPLGQHLPGGARISSPDSSGQPNDGAYRSHTLETIQHQIRSLGQQYSSSTTPLQKLITSEKGVAIDFDSVARGKVYCSTLSGSLIIHR